jgi:hypothetical protein
MRLRSLTAGLVPSYVKIEHFPITAAFGSGNSSAARRARVALQWRDKKGRWVEMGRGGNFKFSMPDGSSALASGIYVGVSPDGQNGLFQVTGDKNLADGIYSVPAQNVEIFSARIPESALAKAGIKKKAPRNEALLPSLESVKNSRQDAPTGWKKNADGTFTSDDNYTVKFGDGEYTLFRQNEDGSLGEKVGEAANWADVNDLANGDNEAYDKIKGDVVARIVSPEREQERRESNARLDELEKIADSGTDERGNPLPAGWDAVIRPGVAEARQQRRIGNDQILQNESTPTLVYEKVAAEVPGRPDKPYVISARMMEDGRLLSEGIWDSWEALDAGIPERVNAEGKRIQAKLEPISYGGADSNLENYIVDFETLGSSDMFEEIPGLEDEDPTEMTDEESIAKWLEAKGLDKLGVKAVRFEKDGLAPRVEFEIPTSAKEAFSKAYGLNLDENLGDGIDKVTSTQNGPTERYTVDFETLGSSDMFEDIPGLEDEDPTDMTEEEALQKWIEGKGLDKLGVKVVSTSRDGSTPRVTFDIPVQAKDAFGEAYGLNLDENLGDGVDKAGSSTRDKEIFDRRMAGESLDKVAKDYGLTRQQVRKIESDYMKQTGNFNSRFDEVKKLADSNAAAEEFFNALFKDAEYATPDDEDQQKYNIPADAKIYFTDMDNTLVQYSDGTWHDHSSEGYETPAEEAVYDYFKDALLKNTGDAPIVFYYGSFVDGNLQNKMAEGRDNLPIEIDDDGPDEPPTPPSGGGSGGRTPDSISADDAKELSNLVDNTYSVDALSSDYELYKDKNGDLTLRARVEDGTKGGVVLSGFTYIDVATVSDDGKVTWKNDSLREEHKDNFIPAMNSILFMHDLNAGRPRPKDFIYFDGETGETIDTSLTEFPESFKEYFDNLTKKVHAAGGSIEDEELSSKELKSLLSRPAGSIFRVFLPKNISDDTLKDIVKAGSIEGVNDDDESVQDYVDLINEQRSPGDGGSDEPSDLTEIDKSALDALNEIVERDGEYNMEGITFASPDIGPYDYSPGSLVMYPDSWEPGDKIIGRIDQDGIIDWESDAQYDKYADKLREVLRGMGDSGADEPPTPPSSGDGNSDGSSSVGKDSTNQLFDSINRAEGGEESVLLSDELLNADLVDEDTQKLSSAFNKNEAIDAAVDMFKQKYSELLNKAIEYIYDESPVELDDPYVAVEPSTPSQEFGASTVEQLFDSVDREESGESYVLLTEEIYAQGFGDAEDQMPSEFDRNKTIDAAVEVFRDRYTELLNEAISNVTDEEDGPGEPPSGGTPPKTPSPSSPQAPALFKNFDVPSGAFQLRTVDYEPEGRVDEKSSDYTDVPKIIATRYTPQDLVRGMSQALLGNSSDAAVDEILSANVDDDNDIVDPADLPDNVDISSVNVGTPSGAGQLEFSAGAEFVPAEALYLALYEAGLDPNRVIANIYDSANGNSNNLNKLIEAQGGVPSQEEAELVDDIVQEIRQLKEVSEPGDSPVANEKQTPSSDPLPGALIENIPIDFENPDYYIPNPEAYIPSQPDVDENGYTDNPEIISADYEVADLIEQMLSGITDGSGAALLAFDNITVEVPIEAMRDAIQYQGINTNQILLDLKKESNDMSEPSVRSDSPTLQAHSELIRDLIQETGGTVDDETVDKIRDAIDQEGLLDWSEADEAEIIEAIAEVAGPGILGQVPARPAARRLPPTTGQRQAPETPADSAETPRDPSADEPTPNASTTRVLSYPGPENRGYHPDNTTLDVVGKVMGYGSRIRASRDGATGTVIAVQNIDSRSGDRIPYVRVLFDDGRIAVRSALKVRVTDQDAQRVAPVDQVPQRPRPLPDVSSRLDAENPSTGIVATDGSIRGVNSLGIIPEELADLTNPNARQVDFAQWGERAGEIARAGRERVTLDNIRQVANELEITNIELNSMSSGPEQDSKKEELRALKSKLTLMLTDSFGIREGVTFGRNEFSIAQIRTSSNITGTVEQIRSGMQGLSIDQEFAIEDASGNEIGGGSRSIRLKFNQDGTSYWTVKNNTLKIFKDENKETGFATAYNRFMEDWYIANGVREIHVYAAGGSDWEGGFVWALNGFNWDGPERAESGLTSSLNWLRRNVATDTERKHVNYLLKKFNDAKIGDTVDLDKVPTPLEIALVGWYPGAEKWIGRKYMINTTWEGIKRLDPKAKEQMQALNYDQMRAARKRLEKNENRAGVSRELSLLVSSNEFENKNVELQTYLEDIRDVFKNDRSMAVLSPAAKTALSRFISNELLKKKEERQVAFNDILQLRRVLDAEYAADHPNTLPKDFGVGKDLTSATLTQIETNTIPGFTVRELGYYESGYNTSYLVTHNDSGQVFYLKEDHYSDEYNINPVRTEVEAGVLARGLGLRGGYETRGNENNEKIVIMQQAGASLALYGNPQNAYQVFSDGAIISSDDTLLRFDTKEEFVDHLASPEDAIRITLLDLLINNADRHNGNVLIAVDAADSRKLRLLPIDHSASGLGNNTETNFNFEDILDPGGEDNIYNRTMPVLTKRMSQDELLAIFRNEADRLRSELKNESLLPTGIELALIEKEWGSIDKFREVINNRLDMLLSPKGEMLPDMMDMLKPGYWT